MFSPSLRKLLALTEELWRLDFEVCAYLITNKKPFKSSKDAAKSSFILVMEGTGDFAGTEMQ